MADRADPESTAHAPQKPNHGPLKETTRSALDIDRYQLGEYLGEGAYGQVWKAVNDRTKRKVAIKRITAKKENPQTGIRLLREAKILRHLGEHENIIKFHGFLSPPQGDSFKDMLLVFDLMPCSLRDVFRKKRLLKPREVNEQMFQLVRGVRFIHQSSVIHRDLKPENLLYNPRTKYLKICDFGMARAVFGTEKTVTWADSQLLTSNVSTIWYRAPELLLMPDGKTYYNSAIDVWSMGCIFAEMLLGEPLFKCENESDLLRKILSFTGVPSDETIKDFASPAARKVIKDFANQGGTASWPEFSENADAEALELVRLMLKFNPNERPTAAQILEAEYFAAILERAGAGRDSEEISKSEFEFENKLKKESRSTYKELFREITNEVGRSDCATRNKASETVLRERSKRLLHMMDGSPSRQPANALTWQPELSTTPESSEDRYSRNVSPSSTMPS